MESVSRSGAKGFRGLFSPGWSFNHDGNVHDDYKSALKTFDSPKSKGFSSPRIAFGSPKDSSFFRQLKLGRDNIIFRGKSGSFKERGFIRGNCFLRFDSFRGPGSLAAPASAPGGNDDHSVVRYDEEK